MMTFSVALSDVLCTIAFGTAVLFVALLPAGADRPYLRPVKAFMVIAMSLYLFVGVSNVLEWGGVTASLDRYEDYAEVLFIPLMAYLVFSMSASQQLEGMQRAEALLRGEHELLGSVVDASPTGILVVSADGSVSYANDRARDALGLRLLADEGRYLARDDVRFGAEPGSVASVTEGLRSLVAQGAVDDVLRYVEHPGGGLVALDVGARPLGAGTASVVAFVDATERLRYRQDLERAVETRTRELIEANRRLALANDAKRDFLARMSHEVRGPLNSIVGFTGTLLQGSAGELTGEQRRQLEMVRASGSQLLGIVNDVLDIEMIEAGRTPITKTPVDLSEVLRNTTELVRPLAVDRAVDIDVVCGTTPLMVMSDADKLAQVVRSLLAHAIEVSGVGGWVRIVTGASDGSAWFAVSDSGPGVPKDKLPYVFDMFAPHGGAVTGAPGGAGLGLAIARDLVGLLGGGIRVESPPAAGTTFTVTVPLAEDGAGVVLRAGAIEPRSTIADV